MAALPGDYGKPRPNLIVQNDMLWRYNSVVVCPFSTDLETQGVLRILVVPNADNGLHHPSLVMVEKVTAIDRTRVRSVLGSLTTDELSEIDERLALVLGI